MDAIIHIGTSTVLFEQLDTQEGRGGEAEAGIKTMRGALSVTVPNTLGSFSVYLGQ